jgi:hypothetical protein
MSGGPRQVIDGKGEPLQTGDGVKSLRAFDAGHMHRGVITKVDVDAGRVSIRHRAGCCDLGRTSEDCDPRFWMRVLIRPTAWQRILGDDE